MASIGSVDGIYEEQIKSVALRCEYCTRKNIKCYQLIFASLEHSKNSAEPTLAVLVDWENIVWAENWLSDLNI